MTDTQQTAASTEVEYVDVASYPFSIDLFSAVGRIAIAMARIDDLLNLALYRIAGLSQEDGAIVVGAMSISKKEDVLRKLVRAHPETKPATMDAMFEAIAQMNSLRNALCHGVYLGMDPTTKSLLFGMRTQVLAPEAGQHSKRTLGYTEDDILRFAAGSDELANAVQSAWGLTGTSKGRIKPDTRKQAHSSPRGRPER